MKTRLDALDRSQFVTATILALRALKRANQTMTYPEFGRFINLIGPDDKWHIVYRRLLGDILNATSAIKKQAASAAEGLEFGRVVDRFGKPGAGFNRDVRIDISKAPKLVELKAIVPPGTKRASQ